MKIYIIFLLLLAQLPLRAQQADLQPILPLNTAQTPCIDEATYAEMEAVMQKNIKQLGLNHASQKKSTSLQWPLRKAAALKDCNYYYISAFVDQDTTSGVKDWNCGTRTYNAHRGVDIVPWPFIWDKMDRNLVEVIAAAAGTIIAKVDGNADRVCNGVGGGSNSNNYISIQHADGSVALYVHMKTGSLTTKTVGQTIAQGEYLGVVGSAGQSTGVHLHFEIRTDGTFAHYADPFFGSCNSKISASWWAVQEPYIVPDLLKLSLHSSWPYMGVCPVTRDTTYERDTFVMGKDVQATFYACTKHVSTGDTWNFTVKDASQNTVDSWNYTSTSNRNISTLGYNRALPALPGVYTFEADFKGIVCKKTFVVQQTTALDEWEDNAQHILVTPTETSGIYKIQHLIAGKGQGPAQLEVYSLSGAKILTQDMSAETHFIDLSGWHGLFIFRVTVDAKSSFMKQLLP